MNTSIVLIVFNRADTTRKVIDALRLVQPSRLFVVADGPRAERAGENERFKLLMEGIQKYGNRK